jgi:O-antigen ligase
MAAVLAWSVGQRSYGLLGLFLAGASVLTVSRSGIFGLLVGAAVLVLAQRGQRLRVLVLVLGAAAISVTAFSNLSLFRETVDNRIFQSSYQQDTRENTLKIVAGDFNDRPLSLLIGQGLRSKQRELAAQGGNAGFSTLDNQFATFLYDVGVVPFLLGSGLIVVGIRRALPERRRIFLPPLMAGLAIFAFFDGLYWSGTAALFFFLLGGASSTSRFGRGHV